MISKFHTELPVTGNQRINNEMKINLSVIIESLPSMIYRRKNDSEWTMEFVSAGSRKVTGFSPDQFLTNSTNYKNLILPEDIGNVLTEIDSTLAAKKPFTINYRIYDINNKIKWIFERGEGIFSADNNLIAVEGFITDISEEKKVQKKYDETNSLLNATINAIGEGILVISHQEKVTYYNSKFLEMLGVTESFMSNYDRGLTLRLAESKIKNGNAFIGKVKELNSEPYSENKDVIELKDGRFIEWLSKPQILEGIAVGRVWSFLDITERMLLDNNLSHEKDLLQALMDNIPDLIYFKDINSKFTRINKAEAEVLGINDPAEAIGKTDFDYFDHAHIAYEDEQRVMHSKTGLIAKVEKIKQANGDYRWVTATKMPVLDKSGLVVGTVGISRNITESKIAEEKLQKYSQELNEINASKDKLFSIIAHDLRSPLSPLLGLSEIIAKDFDSLTNEEIRLYSQEINTALKCQFNLLENLLSWSRMESGRITFNPVEFNLRERVNDAFELMKRHAKDKNISITNNVDETSTVFADKAMVNSILQNFITNAIKFTRSGGEINIYSKLCEKHIELAVADNGVGIKEEDMNNILSANYFTTYGTNKEKGTGLGLIICKEMIERNDGKIWIESEYNSGTKVTFTLPRPVK